MKYLKWILCILGLVGLIFGGVMLAMTTRELHHVRDSLDQLHQHGVIVPLHKSEFAALGGTVGGILLGYGLGLPKLTRRTVRKEYQHDLESRGVVVTPEKKD